MLAFNFLVKVITAMLLVSKQSCHSSFRPQILISLKSEVLCFQAQSGIETRVWRGVLKSENLSYHAVKIFGDFSTISTVITAHFSGISKFFRSQVSAII